MSFHQSFYDFHCSCEDYEQSFGLNQVLGAELAGIPMIVRNKSSTKVKLILISLEYVVPKSV